MLCQKGVKCFKKKKKKKILGSFKLKVFANNELKLEQKRKCFLDRTENIIVEKGENDGYQHFLLFSLCF